MEKKAEETLWGCTTHSPLQSSGSQFEMILLKYSIDTESDTAPSMWNTGTHRSGSKSPSAAAWAG